MCTNVYKCVHVVFHGCTCAHTRVRTYTRTQMRGVHPLITEFNIYYERSRESARDSEIYIEIGGSVYNVDRGVNRVPHTFIDIAPHTRTHTRTHTAVVSP